MDLFSVLTEFALKGAETMNKRKLASLEITNDKGFIFPVMSFIDSLVQRHTSIDASRYQQIRFVALEVVLIPGVVLMPMR